MRSKTRWTPAGLMALAAVAVFDVAPATANAASQDYCITNQFNFGGSENDAPYSIIGIADGYVMCGYTNSHDGSFNVPHDHDVDGFIAKFDLAAYLQWKKLLQLLQY